MCKSYIPTSFSETKTEFVYLPKSVDSCCAMGGVSVASNVTAGKERGVEWRDKQQKECGESGRRGRWMSC